MKWWQWEKGENRKLTKKKKEGVVEDLIQELKLKMETFSKHILNARWQYQQYQETPPPPDTAVSA